MLFSFMNSKQLLLQSLKQKKFSKEILEAFSEVERKDFIHEDLRKHAYDDIALSIGKNQTISQPYTISVMLSLMELKKGEKVLEIGSGCGYALALLSKIVGSKGKVFGVERIKELFELSKENLKEYNNVKVYNRNGFFGLKEKSGFDKILISAAIEKIPKPLIEQLKNKGTLVSPIGKKHEQSIISYKKIKNELKIKKRIPGFIFVPFVE